MSVANNRIGIGFFIAKTADEFSVYRNSNSNLIECTVRGKPTLYDIKGNPKVVVSQAYDRIMYDENAGDEWFIGFEKTIKYILLNTIGSCDDDEIIGIFPHWGLTSGSPLYDKCLKDLTDRLPKTYRIMLISSTTQAGMDLGLGSATIRIPQSNFDQWSNSAQAGVA